MKLDKESDLRKWAKAALIDADCFFWWTEFGYGGTAGVPDLSAFVWFKPGGEKVLVPVELKMGKLTQNNLIKLDRVQPGQVKWHSEAYKYKMPAALMVAFDNHGHDTIMITRGVDLLSHRAGLQPSGLIAPASHVDSGDVVKEIYKQGMRQAL